MTARSEQTFRAVLSSYLAMGGLFGGMFAFTLYATVFMHPSFWKAAASLGAVFVLVLIWLAAFEIRITDDELRLRSLVSGAKQIRHTEIRKVRLSFDLRAYGGPLRLLIEHKGRGVPPLSINAKVFSREAIAAVLDLGKRVGSADSAGLEDGIVARAVRRERSHKTERDA